MPWQAQRSMKKFKINNLLLKTYVSSQKVLAA